MAFYGLMRRECALSQISPGKKHAKKFVIFTKKMLDIFFTVLIIAANMEVTGGRCKRQEVISTSYVPTS